MNKETYTLKLQVKSPLFIGSGQSYNRINYVNDYSSKKIYILDENKWINYLMANNVIDNFIENIGNAPERFDLKRFIEKYNRIFRIRDFQKFYKKISSHVLDTSHLSNIKSHPINIFIKDFQGRPYIPGSSIKGAISNAILKDIVYRSSNELRKVTDFVKNYNFRNKRSARTIDNNIMKNMDYKKRVPGQQISEFKGMAGIQISDSTAFSLNDLKIYKKVDIAPRSFDDANPEEKSSKIPLFRECAEIGTEIEFKIALDYMKLHPDFNIRSLNDLLQILNRSFEMVYGSKGVFSTYKHVAQFLPQQDKNETFLQLGGGAGFHSKTIISSLKVDAKERNKMAAKILSVRAPRHKHDRGFRFISPRCLKIADIKKQKILMGICKISEK